MKMPRRRFLRGLLASGAAVAVQLPLLDLFLNDHGTAHAGGAPLPVRFGTWFWGNGMNPARWVPSSEGTGYELSEELAVIAPYQDKISVLSGYQVLLDGRPNIPHVSGVMANLTGTAPEEEGEVPAPTLDTLIAGAIGGATRFRSLEVSASGDRSHTYSRVTTGLFNPSEISPLEFYTRLFGPEFHDPKDGEFQPDPELLLRRSILSVVSDDRRRLEGTLGSHDRQRLDQYFTALRQLEQQLLVLTSEPPNLAACARPDAPMDEPLGNEIEVVAERHRQLTELLVMALACDQTRVFNMLFSWGLSELRMAGNNTSHHQMTHDEPIDPDLGYQPNVSRFIDASMDAWVDFVARLEAVPEGAGTLLDNCLVFAHSESSLAKTHDITDLPIMLAGSGGGRFRTGLHLRGNGEPITRVGLTLQNAFGVPAARWGTGSLEVNQPVSEILDGL
jgi:hypothetical protein